MTTPETILARFAADYVLRDKQPNNRLRITYEAGNYQDGCVIADEYGRFYTTKFNLMICVDTKAITRIDHANARYRGTAPLWQREG